MGSLTLNLDEGVLRRARIRALEQGTSVNALVREWLERYADAGRQRDTTEAIVSLLSAGNANSDSDSWQWNRDDVYDNHLNRYGV